jgi:hypothetical protein
VQEYKGFICVYASKNQDSLFTNLDLKRKNAESTIQEAMCRKFHLKRADSEYMDKVKKIEEALDKKLSD